MAAYMHLNGVPAAANTWLLTDVLRGSPGPGIVQQLELHPLVRGRLDDDGAAANLPLEHQIAILTFSTVN